ncbi:uncharacterized protein LOC130440615 [Diorhabda sublineata]|uniref:uncharacterized protein LOC130440615 n=1 Tax=Diorhabda sublineata TaxID=1163346 RepID=UPI0024E0DBB9|nr:uncharacterized protein LOC130440615 [Diorhabda sublineata]
MAELGKLIKKRGVIKAQLTIFTKAVNEFATISNLSQTEVTKLKDRLRDAENYLDEFKSYQLEIELQDDINLDEQLIERERFENSYYDAIAVAKNILQSYNNHDNDTNLSVISDKACCKNEGIKLPDISLPKFSGNFEDWLEFRDTYKSLIHDRKNMPLLIDTVLGWVVSGQISTNNVEKASCNLSINQELLNSIAKFWEIEEISSTRQLSPDEQFCEDNFIKTTTRDANGRFTVTIPLKQQPSSLGESKAQAEKRFYALERKFRRDPMLHSRYIQFMNEYKELGHMTICNGNDSSFEYFMPHHGVLREESLTTKLRVVFDASAPSSNGLSFNNIQVIGPVLQDDLLSIVLRFRKYNYVVSADIVKMYRQISITPEQRHLQKIVWRENPSDNLEVYQLNTVTYGQASASYLAIRCLAKLAEDIQEMNPEIAEIIKHDFYVDDLLTGAPTLEHAQYICKAISDTLKSGCFALRKWCSNDTNALKNISSNDLKSDILEFAHDGKTKTLGLIWVCNNDKLQYKIHTNPIGTKVTKRTILSTISKIFDILGLLSPCTIIAKMIMQKLWENKLAWDDAIPKAISENWVRLEKELLILNDLELNRQAICKNAVELQLHGFADASEKAYGACVYLRSIDSDQKVHVSLLCAKAKVVPIKTIPIPRLELCAALLLARLTDKAKTALKIQFKSFTLWSDSTITLAWVRTSPNLLKTFTAHRVAEIQSLTKHADWRHIPTHDNPADIASRGIYPSQILNSDLWWRGPTWLAKDPSFWPNDKLEVLHDLPELKSSLLTNVAPPTLIFPFERFSNFSRMQRTMAYILRFKDNCLQRNRRRGGSLTVQELSDSLKCLIRICQSQSYSTEIETLKNNKPLSSHSNLLSLSPFLEPDGLLRVGGRLKHSNYSFDKRHPILINSKHHFSKLLFLQEHERLLHGGPQLLLSTIRENYWVISGRNLARKTVKNCVKCFKFNAKTIQPIMANLPRDRTNPSSAFSIVGVDYAGPFMINDKKGRGCRLSKCYIGVFICLSTKAVHLELISSLSSESFIQALYRFVSRRGKPSKILSDNGTSFVGAQRELKDFLKHGSNTIIEKCSSQNIEWSFIPPYSPHFGGLWEAAVKSVKHHLRRVLTQVHLSFEEFATVLAQIEAILNSRPLCPLSSDPNDFGPLTPAHFLIGRPIIAAPDQDVTDIKMNRLSRFQLVQQLAQHFWNRWKSEYIAELQRRTKWKSNQGHLVEDSLVLVKGENTMPTQWLLGRISKLHRGPDGIARVASIRTPSGEIIKRSFQKICPLPVDL